MEKNSIKILLGQRIKALRELTHLTQEQLGEKIGKEQDYISRIENGKRFPSSDILDKFKDVFNISYSQLFNFNNSDNEQILNQLLYSEIEEIKDSEAKKFLLEMIKIYKEYHRI